MNVNLKYPGAMRFFTIKVKNTGTIDAVLNVNDSSELNLTETIKVYNSETDILEKTLVHGTEEFSRLKNQFAKFEVSNPLLEKEDGTILGEDDDLIANSRLLDDSDGKTYLKIASNETIYVLCIYEWDSRVTSQEYYSVNSVTMQFVFNQIKSGMTVSTDGAICFDGC